jgi:hypothetical protein
MNPNTHTPFGVLIAGGGVAGLEAVARRKPSGLPDAA